MLPLLPIAAAGPAGQGQAAYVRRTDLGWLQDYMSAHYYLGVAGQEDHTVAIKQAPKKKWISHSQTVRSKGLLHSTPPEHSLLLPRFGGF